MSTACLAAPQIVTVEEAEEILGPYRDRLNRCIQHGWDAWKTDYLPKHHILGPRSRAAIVFDEIVNRAMEEFSDVPDVKPLRLSNSFMLYIGDRITLRFKKIKRNGRCSNIHTKQQVLFLAQAQMRLPTMLDGTLVHAGYTLDDLQQEVLRKTVVCQLHNHVLWQLSLSGDTAAIVELVPAEPLAPTGSTDVRPRFVLKPELVEDLPAAKIAGQEE